MIAIMCSLFSKKRKMSLVDSANLSGGFSGKKEEEIDMNNIIQSIFHADSLYNKLKIKCHPDRFVHDIKLMEKADDLFKEITENKRDFKKLRELQIIVENELHVTI
jgi:hypothetical protein